MEDQEVIRLVNINYRRIKVTGKNYIYPVNKSVGFAGLAQMIGEDKAMKMFRDSLNCKEDVFKRTLGRGLTIKFESA
jgi:hypothetical protein